MTTRSSTTAGSTIQNLNTCFPGCVSLNLPASTIRTASDTARSQAGVKPYVESKGYKWRVLFDPNGEILKRYGGTSIPYTVLLDKTGNASFKVRGAIKNVDELTQKITALTGAAGE